jgi:hypothetical protein
MTVYAGVAEISPEFEKAGKALSGTTPVSNVVLPHVPEGVEVCERAGDGRRVLVLINHSTESKQVALADLLKGRSASSVELEKYGVAVLED